MAVWRNTLLASLLSGSALAPPEQGHAAMPGAFGAPSPALVSAVAAAQPTTQQDQARIHSLTGQLQQLLDDCGVQGVVSGRVKTPESVAAKMARKGVPRAAIVDRLAVRVVVPTVADCYAVFDAARGTYGVLPHETDDYIAHPKPNGYQSLHTALVEPGHAEPFELQVRTVAMHAHAEHGGAAHWRYKLGA